MGLSFRLQATRRRLTAVGLALVLASGIAVLSACGSSSSLPSGVVAQVGDTQITSGQLNQYMKELQASAIQQGQTFPTPGSANYSAAQQQAVQQLIQLQIVANEAAKCGGPCAVSDSAVTTQIDTLAKQRFGGSQAKLLAYLSSLGLSMDQARQQVRAGLQQQKLQKYIERGVTFTPAQAKAYYSAHQSQFNVPEQRTVSHILVKTEAEAKRIAAEATPANFAALAKKYSIDPGSKAAGGSLGAITESEVVPSFGKVAFALKKGAISQPVQSQYGWHIIYVTKITAPHSTSEAAALPGIISSQIASLRSAAYSQWVSKTLAYWNARTKYASGFAPPATGGTGTTSGG